jgi:prepilin-type N-terminal cleavage/methylation domain-containing protein
MKKPILLYRSKKGFTLLEVIIVVVIAAILGSLLFSFMGTAVTKSGVPVNQTRNLGTTMGNIETITATYASYLSGGMTWVAFKAACGTYTEVSSGGLYSSKFQTIQVARTVGDQTLVSYFTE